MLKIDLHIHAKEDKKDKIKHSAKQVIDKAVKEEFNAISFTFHDDFFYPRDLVQYAKSKNLLLIPGTELSVQKKDILVYNISEKEFEILKNNNKSFKTFIPILKKLKHENKNIFVVAAHPYFFLSCCLKKNLEKHIDIFDGVEFSWFFSKTFNFNKKAVEIAKKNNIPIIANSDCHIIDRFGKNFSIIDCKKYNSKNIFKAIKDNKIEIHSKPLTNIEFLIFTIKMTTIGLISKKIVSKKSASKS